MFKKTKRLLLGKPRDPMQKNTRQHISLVAFFAWIGLGADGLSSSSYGPEQAFLALGSHHYLALYLALMIFVTVFIIALAYNQVIELFPSGGGGYKVATRLIGPFAGLVSGTALITGYVLTIAVSIASGIDAVLSLLPLGAQAYKIGIDCVFILLLVFLNMRGMKESIKIFMPIFLGFVVTHLFIIIYGISAHSGNMGFVFHQTWGQTKSVSSLLGWFFVAALLLRSYSMGGGTYTGLEAISNNVNNLAEPRVRTGKIAMLYMAISLGITAGGIILLYLLWDAQPVIGQTLNAVVFGHILQKMPFGHAFLILILLLEAGLLFVGANTGFLGGPAVLSNMAIDGWVPKRFRSLSSRLVVQNGIVVFGILAIIILYVTQGAIDKLIILYSTSVFLTFSLSLLGLCVYWWSRRFRKKGWLFRLLFSAFGFLVCSTILVTVIATKFTQGGWLTLVVNTTIIAVCLVIKKHYKNVKKLIENLDAIFTFPAGVMPEFIRDFEPDEPTAVIFVGQSVGEAMHTLLWIQRLFPKNYFRNYVFLSAGTVDVNSYESERALSIMQKKVNSRLDYFVNYAKEQGVPAKSLGAYGTDHIIELTQLAEQIKDEFPSSVFFSARIVLKSENWLSRLLHNETPVTLQQRLHSKGMQMIILPVMLGGENETIADVR